MNKDGFELSAQACMRMYRDGKLAEEVDIPIRNFLHSGQAIPQDLIDHRQALLDVPDNNTPELDSDGELTGVDWPTKP
jgi:hypothetical protein